MIKNRKRLVSICVFLFISGCSSTGPVTTQATPTREFIRITQSNSLSTETLAETSTAETYTSTPTISISPTPTITTEEKEKVIRKLMTQDYLCSLPCWGGINPGVTRYSTAVDFLQQITKFDMPTNSAEPLYGNQKTYIGLLPDKGIVDFLMVTRFEYPIFRLLQEYGKPDEVYFYILDTLPIDKNNPYTIFLYYGEKGIIAEYHGVANKGATISACLNDTQGDINHRTVLSLWPEGSNKSFADVISQYMDKFSDYSSLKYFKLEELSSSNVDVFYETYKLESNENKCINIRNPNVLH